MNERFNHLRTLYGKYKEKTGFALDKGVIVPNVQKKLEIQVTQERVGGERNSIELMLGIEVLLKDLNAEVFGNRGKVTKNNGWVKRKESYSISYGRSGLDDAPGGSEEVRFREVRKRVCEVGLKTMDVEINCGVLLERELDGVRLFPYHFWAETAERSLFSADLASLQPSSVLMEFESVLVMELGRKFSTT